MLSSLLLCIFSPGRGSLPDVLALRGDAEQGMVEAVGGQNFVKGSCPMESMSCHLNARSFGGCPNETDLRTL